MSDDEKLRDDRQDLIDAMQAIIAVLDGVEGELPAKIRDLAHKPFVAIALRRLLVEEDTIKKKIEDDEVEARARLHVYQQHMRPGTDNGIQWAALGQQMMERAPQMPHTCPKCDATYATSGPSRHCIICNELIVRSRTFLPAA